MAERKFTSSKGTRRRVPLLIGLYGPSGSGKTKSALRLATGAQRITGGRIKAIDTEAKRMLAYAPAPNAAPDGINSFDFDHIELDPPFDPDSYMQALRFAKEDGGGVAIVDSASHMHEGHGGLLEWHDAELARLGGKDSQNFTAWIKPKRALSLFLAELMRLDIGALIFCFRAKEKLKIVSGKQPVQLGWMPIQSDEFAYEMTLNALLTPGCQGVPTWRSREPGEEVMIKLPGQFDQLVTGGRQFDEAMGEALALWAAGGAAPAKSPLFHKSYAILGGQPLSAAPLDAVCEYIGWLEEKTHQEDPQKSAAAKRLHAAAEAWYDNAVGEAMDRDKAQASESSDV